MRVSVHAAAGRIRSRRRALEQRPILVGLALSVVFATIASAVVLVSSEAAARQDAIAALDRSVAAEAQALESFVESLTRDVRLASRDSVLHERLESDQALDGAPARRAETALAYIGERYQVDEICLIRTDGREMARWTLGVIAPPEDLSEDESGQNPAFAAAIAAPDDVAIRTDPYVSPDSERWVVGIGTPIDSADGVRRGILHVEIPLGWLHRELAHGAAGTILEVDDDPGAISVVAATGVDPGSSAPASLLVHSDGRVLADSGHEGSGTMPLISVADFGSHGVRDALDDALGGRASGILTFEDHSGSRTLAFRRVLGGSDVLIAVVPDDVLFADAWRSRVALIAGVVPLLILMVAIFVWSASRLSSMNAHLRDALSANRRLAGIVESAGDAILSVAPDGTILTWNEGAERLHGGMRAEMVGASLTRMVPAEHADEVMHVVAAALRGELVRGHESVMVTKAGAPVEASLTASPVYDDGGAIAAVSVVARDITDRRRLERELERQALHDSLTGLPNRTLFRDRLEAVLRRAERYGEAAEPAAILFIDIDDFKVVNDTLGHKAGDRLLVDVASRIAAVIRPEDTACRLGGDEFTILLESVHGVEGAVVIARRILDQMREPFGLERRTVTVSVSIGIALSESDVAPDDLMRRADVALYEAKSRGKGRHEVFDAGMDARAWQRLESEVQLRQALDGGEITVWYQPIVDLADGRVVGVDATPRWLSGPPADARGRALAHEVEQAGLTQRLERDVLAVACAALHEWLRLGARPDLFVALRCSLRELSEPGVSDRWLETIAAAGITGRGVRMTLSDPSGAADDLAGSDAALAALREAGIRFVGDMGDGRVSLDEVDRLPIDMVRIDLASERTSADEGLREMALQDALDVARTFRLAAIVDGVDTPTARDRVRALGVRLGQGAALAEPMTAASIAELVVLHGGYLPGVPASADGPSRPPRGGVPRFRREPRAAG